MTKSIFCLISVSLLASACSYSSPSNSNTPTGGTDGATNIKGAVFLTILEPTADSTLFVGQKVIVNVEVKGTAIEKATAFVLPPLEKPNTVSGTFIDGTPIEIEVVVPDAVGSTTLKAIAIDHAGHRLEGSIPVVVKSQR